MTRTLDEWRQIYNSPASLSQQRISNFARDMITWDRQSIVDRANTSVDMEEFSACIAVLRWIDDKSAEERLVTKHEEEEPVDPEEI